MNIRKTISFVSMSILIVGLEARAAEPQCRLTKHHFKIESTTRSLPTSLPGISLPVLNYETEIEEAIEVTGFGSWTEDACEQEALKHAKSLQVYEYIRWDFTADIQEDNYTGYAHVKTESNDPASKRVVYPGADYEMCIPFLTDDTNQAIEAVKLTQGVRASVYPKFVGVDDPWENCKVHAAAVLKAKTAKYPGKSLKMHYFVHRGAAYDRVDLESVTP